MHRQTLELRNEVLGHEHPKILTSINDVGLVLYNQKKYAEAEVMYWRGDGGEEEDAGTGACKYPYEYR